MTDGADGFDGEIEIVRRTRGYRKGRLRPIGYRAFALSAEERVSF